MYIPIKLSSSIFLMLMVLPATLSSPVDIQHKMKDCGVSSCELTAEEPRKVPDESNTLFNQLLEEFNKQESENKNYKKESAAQLTKHEFTHAQSIVAKSSSYENSGESKSELVEIKTNISHHELNNGKPTVKNVYSYKIISGGDQQMKELETKFSKNNENSADIDENLLKLLPKLDNKNNVSDEKHVNSIIEDSHSYENSAESNRKVIESASKASHYDLSNGNHMSKNLQVYKKVDESNRKFNESKTKVYKHGLATVHSKIDDKESNNNKEIQKLLLEILSKNAKEDSVQSNKHESKLSNQDVIQVNSSVEDSHIYENSAEANKKVTESASKVSQHDFSNGKSINKDLQAYEKTDESNSKYKESESKVFKHGLSVAHSKVNDKESNKNEEIKKLLLEILSKNAEQNSVNGKKPESKVLDQDLIQVNSSIEDSHSYENSAEANKKVTESASKFSQNDLLNGKSINKDLQAYEKTDESNSKYKESESKVFKHGLSVAHSKINDKESNKNEEIKKLLLEILSKNAEQNSVQGYKDESKLPSQEVTHVSSTYENSHFNENSVESTRKLLESALKVSKTSLSNDKYINMILNAYKKMYESNNKSKESRGKVFKHGLTIVHSKANDKESNNNEEIKKLLLEILSKNAEQNSVNGKKPESKVPNQDLIQVNSSIEDSHSYENSAELNRKLIKLASKVSQHDLSNGKSISKDLLSYEKNDESYRKYKESENKAFKHELAIALSKIGNKESTNNEEIKKLLREILSKNAKQNSVQGNNDESKLPTQDVTQVNSSIEDSHSYENSAEANKKVTESASKVSQNDLSNGKSISKDLSSYEKIDESKRKFKESESNVFKHELAIALSKIGDKESNKNEEIKKLLLEILSKNAEQNSVNGKKPESKVPDQDVIQVNSSIEDSHSYENSAEANKKLTESASKFSQNDLLNGKSISKDLQTYEKNDESNSKYKESESKVFKHGLSVAHSKIADKESNKNEEIKKLLLEILSKNAEENSVNGKKPELKLPDQDVIQVNSSIEDSHSYENLAEANKKVTESASKVSQNDLSNGKSISKDLSSYEKIDESKRKFKESESNVFKHELAIALSKIGDKESNKNEEIKKLLLEILSKNAEDNSVNGKKPESKLPKQEVTHVNSVYENSHSYENSAELNRKLIELASKVSQHDLSNGKSISKDLLSYKKNDESNRKYKESKNRVFKHGLTVAQSKNDVQESNSNEEIKRLLLEILSKDAEKNSVHCTKPESKLPNQEVPHVNSVYEDSHSYENSAESKRKLLELASKVSQHDLSNGKAISKDLHSYEKIDESNRKYKELASRVSKHGLAIGHSKIDNKESNNNEAIKNLLIEMLLKNSKQSYVQGNKDESNEVTHVNSVYENSHSYENSAESNRKLLESASKVSNIKISQHNVDDVLSLIGGLMSNKNPVGINNKLLQLAAKISNKEFDSAVALIEYLNYENIPDMTKQKLMELEMELVQHMPADHSSKDNSLSSQIDTVEEDSLLKEQMKAITKKYAEANTNKRTVVNNNLKDLMAGLLRQKLKDIKSESNAALTIKKPVNSNDEVINKLLKGLHFHPYANDALSYDNPTEENKGYKKEVVILHPYGDDMLH